MFYIPHPPAETAEPAKENALNSPDDEDSGGNKVEQEEEPVETGALKSSSHSSDNGTIYRLDKHMDLSLYRDEGRKLIDTRNVKKITVEDQ